MFYTPKPRKFHYEPRFYDPEKEKWEALKAKYHILQKEEGESKADATAATAETHGGNDNDLAYFESKIRSWDRPKKSQRLTLKDLFCKREMPSFNYQPRFNADGTMRNTEEPNTENKHHVRIRRRFDIEDVEYMKPIPAGKIMLYALAAFMILYFVLF